MSSPNSEIKQIFEYELKRKLSLRTKQSTSEVTMLINTFKFFDSMNRGRVNKEEWVRTYGKIGLSGFSDKELSLLYDEYDINHEGSINYKDFAFYLYNVQNPKMSQNEERKDSGSQIIPISEQITQKPISNIFEPEEHTRNTQINPTLSHQSQSINQPVDQSDNEQLQQKDTQPIQHLSQHQQQQYNKTYQCRTPLKFEIKKYFKYLLELIQHKVNIKNGLGYFTFAFKLKQIEDKLYKVISFENYIKCLTEMQIDIQPNEAKDFFSLLDLSDREYISTDELLRLLRYPINEKRRVLITNQFPLIDINRRGECDTSDVKSLFNAHEHPEVKAGRKTENEIYQEFIFAFETFLQLKQINTLSLNDFIDFYSIVSGSIDNDEYFEMMVTSVWRRPSQNNRPQEDRGSRNSYQEQQNNFFQDQQCNQQRSFSQQDQYLRTPLNSNIIKPNQVRYNPINNSYVLSTQSNEQMKKDVMPITDQVFNRNFQEKANQSILKLRNILMLRGAKGIFGLQRMLKMYDRNSTKNIRISDFESLCQAYRINITPNEVDSIFAILDTEQRGEIVYDSLINLLTGEMNTFRLNIVKKAFAFLDRNRTNSISMNDMKTQFNFARHPDVVMKKKSEDETLGEWLDNLEAFCLYNDISSYQSLTIDQFIRFYNLISMSIEEDRFFEYMIINVWNLDRNSYGYQRQPQVMQQPPQQQLQQQPQSLSRPMRTGNEIISNRPY